MTFLYYAGASPLLKGLQSLTSLLVAKNDIIDVVSHCSYLGLSPLLLAILMPVIKCHDGWSLSVGRLTKNAIRRRRVHATGLTNSGRIRVRVDHDIANYLLVWLSILEHRLLHQIQSSHPNFRCNAVSLKYFIAKFITKCCILLYVKTEALLLIYVLSNTICSTSLPRVSSSIMLPILICRDMLGRLVLKSVLRR